MRGKERERPQWEINLASGLLATITKEDLLSLDCSCGICFPAYRVWDRLFLGIDYVIFALENLEG